MNFKSTNPNISLIEDYYNHFEEENRLSTRHGQVEFLTTIKYILEILNNDKSKKIIDIGAGTGRYSVYLDSLGYDVTAVELVQHNIDVFKNKESNVKIHQGNALDLSMFNDDTFDVTLLFGPMYHLLNKDEQIKALSEAKRITKKDGFILISYYMNEYAFITYAIVKGHILECLNNGQLDENYHTKPIDGDLYTMVRIEDIDEFNRLLNLKRYKIIAQDGASDYIRSAITRLTEEQFQEYVKYHFSIAERPDLIGASSHVLDIVKK